MRSLQFTIYNKKETSRHHTDATGYVDQHIQYLPFGELFISQRNTSFDSRYKFTAKELDNETQYTYFGARYLDSDISIWLSVDPLAWKYPSLSPYMYVAGNPLRLIDPNGMEIDPTDAESEKSFNNYISSFGTNVMSGTKLFGLKKQENGRYTSSLRLSERKFNKRMDKAGVSEDKRKDAMNIYKSLQSEHVIQLRVFDSKEGKSDFFSKHRPIGGYSNDFYEILETFFSSVFVEPFILDIGGMRDVFDPEIGFAKKSHSDAYVFYQTTHLVVILEIGYNFSDGYCSDVFLAVFNNAMSLSSLGKVFSFYYSEYPDVTIKGHIKERNFRYR